MNSKKNITQVIEREVITLDGEIIKSETETSTKYVEKEPDYIKMYVSDIARLKDIPRGMDKVLMGFIKQMGYNNVIATIKPIKQMIAKQCGVGVDYVNKCVKTFKKQGILIPVARGVYIADPNLFARGNWNDIKQLRLVIDYGSNGTKKLKSNLPEQLQLRLGFEVENTTADNTNDIQLTEWEELPKK